MGEFGLGVRNENGDRLLEFCMKNNMKIANTFFNKKKRKNGLGDHQTVS